METYPKVIVPPKGGIFFDHGWGGLHGLHGFLITDKEDYTDCTDFFIADEEDCADYADA